MRLDRVPSCALALAIAACFAGFAEGFFTAVPVPMGASKLLGRSAAAAAAVVLHENGAAVGALGEHQRVGYAVLGVRVAGLREALGGRTASRGSRSHVLVAAAAGKDGEDGASGAGFGLEDKTIEELWTRPRKHLMSVGKAGVKSSHVRSLNALVEAHTLVKVKINIPGADLGEVGLQLCGSGAAAVGGGGEGDSSPVSAEDASASSSLPTSVSVVTSRDNQHIILFAKTEFLATLAKGEVFNN